MPRKPRPIHAERIYHVFNRGNYKLPLFDEPGAGAAFLEALDESIEVHQWEVYAYALMPDHYHLCLRTPHGDLSQGMHRLLTRFATRFNGFRKESGHVFQGRFKAKVASQGKSARRIIDYIHLNPARKGEGHPSVYALGPWTSLRAYLQPEHRGRLAIGEAMGRFIGFEDTEQGRLAYVAHLDALVAADPDGKELLSDIREDEKSLAKEVRDLPGPISEEVAKGRQTVAAEAEARWEKFARVILLAHSLSPQELLQLPKGHPSKLLIAQALRAQGATSAWIAARLHMGTPGSVRALLSSLKGSGRNCAWRAQLRPDPF